MIAASLINLLHRLPNRPLLLLRLLVDLGPAINQFFVIVAAHLDDLLGHRFLHDNHLTSVGDLLANCFGDFVQLQLIFGLQQLEFPSKRGEMREHGGALRIQAQPSELREMRVM